MDDEQPTDVFYITYLFPDDAVEDNHEDIILEDDNDNHDNDNHNDDNLIRERINAPYRTLGGGGARPQRFRDFYRPRYAMDNFMDFLTMYINNMSEDVDADATAVQNHSFFNDVVAKPIITEEQIAAVLAKTPQVAFGTIAAKECDICYWPYDGDSVIRHHSNCCGKYTCENCFRKMIAEKLDCPYCIRPLN